MAESYVMMALGSYRFSLSTAAYTDLERANEWRWPSIDRIGVAPARQYGGPGEETVSMRGAIYPHFIAQRRGLEQVSRMRAEASKGEPLLMVDGTGRVWGEFVITSLRETQTVFFSDGAPRKIEFDMTLAAYGGAAGGGATGGEYDPDPAVTGFDPDPPADFEAAD